MNSQPNSGAMRRMVQARSRLVLGNPFWGTLAMNLDMLDAPGLKTMATDGLRLLFDPDYTLRLTEPETLGVVVHEVCHCADLHPTRRGQRDPYLWNIAADFRVNLDVIACGYVLPGRPITLAQLLNKPAPGFYLYDPQFAKNSVEEIYRIVADAFAKQQRKQGQGQGQGQPQPGQGGPPSAPNGQPGGGVAPGQPNAPTAPGGPANGYGIPKDYADPGGCGGVLDAAPSHDPVARAEAARRWETITRQALDVAGTRPGTLPEHIVERFRKSLDEARTDWRRELRRFTDSTASRDYSWRRPNRRHLWRGMILPGLVPDRPNHVALIRDSSGSVYEGRPQEVFAGEIQSMLDEGACDQLTVIDGDTEVKGEPRTYQSGDVIDLEVEGGGGTSFRQPLQWIAENLPEACAIIYLTDMETSDWGDEPAVPVLWAVYGKPERAEKYAAKAPFGSALFIGD